jgi:hypothetical protein
LSAYFKILSANYDLHQTAYSTGNLRNLRDSGSVGEKLLLLKSLRNARFSAADQLHRFHNLLTFLRAYPNNGALLQEVESILNGFSERADLRHFSDELAGSGIAGCPIDYRFFYPMADWLARHWAEFLHIDWQEFEDPECLMEIMPLMVTYSENSQFDDFDFTPKQWLHRLKSEHETDAGFLIKRIKTLYKSRIEREALHDKLNIPFRLLLGRNTPR